MLSFSYPAIASPEIGMWKICSQAQSAHLMKTKMFALPKNRLLGQQRWREQNAMLLRASKLIGCIAWRRRRSPLRGRIKQLSCYDRQLCPGELINEIRNALLEREPTCYRTCIALSLNDGSLLDYYSEVKSVESLKSGVTVRVVDGTVY